MIFSGFKKSLPQISIFHHPSSPPSTKALALLRSALTSSYPPTKPSAAPLQFDLEVIESTPPTADQLPTILSYSAHSPNHTALPLSTFISAHPTSPSPFEFPQSADGIVQLAKKTPNAFRWPVVVDWTGGVASIGEVDGVRAILEAIRKRRDGEVKEDGEHRAQGWFS